MIQKMHESTNTTKYINATYYSLSRGNLKNDSLAASCITTTKRTTKYEQLFYNLSRCHLLFTADSQLVTPHTARGAAVALISGSSSCFASRHVSIFSATTSDQG